MWAVRACVATAIAALVLFSVAQRLVPGDPWWLELTRYVPYPAPLAVAALALVAASRLGWRWFGAALAASLLLGVIGMGFVWGRPDHGGRPLRLMTYNIKAYHASARAEGFAGLLREVQAQRPDILLVQDHVAITREAARDIWPDGRAFGFEYAYTIGQYIIASRHPLRNCAPLAGPRAGVNYTHARCEVDVEGQRLTLVTTHFESPRQGLNAARREGFEGFDDWRHNHAVRLVQARGLAQDLGAAARPLVVAGDLNAPDDSPVVRALLRAGLRDAFASAGRGYGYTYGHALRVGVSFLRIDHVLVSPEIGVAGVIAGGAQASEHRPVIADLLLPPR